MRVLRLKIYSRKSSALHKGVALLSALSVLSLIWASAPLSAHEELPSEPAEPASTAVAPESSLQNVESRTNQIIIKYRDHVGIMAASESTLRRLSAHSGVALDYVRQMSGDAHVIRLPESLPVSAVERIAASLSALPEVEYAEPDYVMFPAQVTPNDQHFSRQWHYTEQYGIDLPLAWGITRGSSNVVVAVLDTGHRPHPDLVSRVVGGYDFVSDIVRANDGNGRDNDPLDPGDWVTPAESASGPLAGCPVSDSSWHGTHVAGTIGAVTNNSVGVAGVDWFARILSVRVLGKCGGFTSDIIDGIRWAAGLTVPGVPNNTRPAKVLNLSLGGVGSCSVAMQSAIDAATAAGAIVVVAAGNSNADARNFTPANCQRVITVGGTTRSGVRAFYSNFGEVVDISAPGGDLLQGVNDGVLSTHNSGTQSPASDTYQHLHGTSMATPHVAGVVSLMAAVRPTLNYTIAESILRSTAKPFGPGHTCVPPRSCGAGIVNAHAAVLRARGGTSYFSYLPIVRRQQSPSSGTWVTITQESFEGAFPPPRWTVTSTNSQTAGYQWGKRNCDAVHGSFSAWAIGGGSVGSTLACGSNYPNRLNTWLIYGPFDLSDATAAQLRFSYRLTTEYGYDEFFWGSSPNGVAFSGVLTTTNTNGWVTRTLNITTAHLGLPQVWIGFNFKTDHLVTYPVGVMVDNVLLRKCTVSTCSTTTVYAALAGEDALVIEEDPALLVSRAIDDAEDEPDAKKPKPDPPPEDR